MDEDFWKKVDALNKLADMATQGEWSTESGRAVVSAKGNRIAIAQFSSQNRIDKMEPIDPYYNAAFMAAANPAFIKEMITRLLSLESEANWFAEQRACKEIKNGCCCGCDREYWRKTARKAVNGVKNE